MSLGRVKEERAIKGYPGGSRVGCHEESHGGKLCLAFVSFYTMRIWGKLVRTTTHAPETPHLRVTSAPGHPIENSLVSHEKPTCRLCELFSHVFRGLVINRSRLVSQPALPRSDHLSRVTIKNKLQNGDGGNCRRKRVRKSFYKLNFWSSARAVVFHSVLPCFWGRDCKDIFTGWRSPPPSKLYLPRWCSHWSPDICTTGFPCFWLLRRTLEPHPPGLHFPSHKRGSPGYRPLSQSLVYKKHFSLISFYYPNTHVANIFKMTF